MVSSSPPLRQCTPVLAPMKLPIIRVVDGDLLDQPVEVIVNAWNRNIIPRWLLLPQGVSGAIKRRDGYGPFRELGSRGSIPLPLVEPF